MSFLDDQITAFRSNLTSSSSKLSTKRTVAAPSVSTPSPAPSHASIPSKQDLKRKRPEPSTIVYSQPADTGTGQNIMTQVTYAVEYLKSKGNPQTLLELLSYLSLQYREDSYKQTIRTILQNHEKVEYDRVGAGGEGTFSFRPIHNIRSKEQLLGYLQAQPTAQGLNVRELRDGWPGAIEAINTLEAQGKLLVTRNRKDDHAKMVWANDPSLTYQIDEEFRQMWYKVKLPEAGLLAEELESIGLTPTNKGKVVRKAPKVQERKTKKPRKTGKTTNTHMVGVLRDYSHLKK